MFPDIHNAALYADVILPLKLPRALTYGVPMELKDAIAVGMRVEVNLGARKIYTGIVAHLHHHRPENFEIKPIKKLLDTHPIISEGQLQFWQWISEYYLAAPGEVMQAALPAHLKPHADVSLIYTGKHLDASKELSDAAYIAAEALHIKKEISFGTLREITGLRDYQQVLEELILHGYAIILDALAPAYQPKTEKYVSLHDDYKNEQALHQLFDELARAPKQLEVLMCFIELQKKEGHVAQVKLLERAKAGAAQLKALQDKGVMIIEEIETERLHTHDQHEQLEFQLNEEQQTTLTRLQEQIQTHAVSLLQGVTGSGKTMLYIQLMRDALQQGKQVLFLVPEIALTTQLVHRLQYFFPQTLGVYHSRYSHNERVEIWQKVQSKTYKIVVGARSSLWLPFQNLGLIIVDEEHDTSFKQHDTAPRFHARDAAIQLASCYAQSKVVLGSATPSIETLFNVQQKKYGYAALHHRYNETALPEIKLIAAKTIDQLRSKGIRTLTPALMEAIQETLDAHQQVILFQNRRGYAPFQLCSVCGWIPQCKNCAVSLTYHRSDDTLRCHYCGLKSAPIHTCASCGSNRIQSKTFGTEKIEEEIKLVFPNARVGRMDVDSMRGKNSLQQLIKKVEQHQLDILVGTQMVVKGLDFKKVGLVGIISADGLLSYPDYRVNERAFQLMEQVSGRAGRDDKQGKVMIQVYKEEHPVLQWVMEHSVRAMYVHEIEMRSVFYYPPFVRLIKIIIKHTKEEKALKAAHDMAQLMATLPAIQVLGPTPALVARIRNQYLFEILIKMPKDKNTIQHTKQAIMKHRETILNWRGNSGITIIPDVDPI